MVAALLSEIEQRRSYLDKEVIKTIYFGGGTPSLLPVEDLLLLIEKIKGFYIIEGNAEVTIEVNPDDITEEQLKSLRAAGMNRLSIGVQSFYEEDLKWMNRAHNAKQAMGNLQLAINHFNNISIDLIYGTPLLTNEKWEKNIETALRLNIPHLSCYALTVEPKTPLHKMIKEHRAEDIIPEKQSEQFLLLMKWMSEEGYEHYEISNFAKHGFRSRHNSSYWQGEKYLGIGPSAHSFDGKSRQWNISNNNIYIDSISKSAISYEKEILTETQKLNEKIMISLRTAEGLNLVTIPQAIRSEIEDASRKFIENGLIIEEGNFLKLTNQGKLLADGIAAELFFVPDEIET